MSYDEMKARTLRHRFAIYEACQKIGISYDKVMERAEAQMFNSLEE
jgi:hypothetical protein